MEKLDIPGTHQTVMPYLIVNGAAKFIGFMQKVFKAKETFRRMRDETHIMHAEVMIGDSTIMFADSTESIRACPAGMFIYVDDADIAYSNAINEGAESVMEPADQDYGRSGGVTDPFGNVWWITSVRK